MMFHVDNTQSFTVLSLCSGVGCLDLGIKLAVPQARTVCYVEIEAYPILVLEARITDGSLDAAPIWTDLESFNGKPWCGKVDCIIGGYPCQPFSNCGKKLGYEDHRALWPHIERIIQEVRPRYCFFENVSHHLRLGFHEVGKSLHKMGYRVAATLFTAEEVGGPHRRERLYILALNSESLGCQSWKLQSRTIREKSVVGKQRVSTRASKDVITNPNNTRLQTMRGFPKSSNEKADKKRWNGYTRRSHGNALTSWGWDLQSTTRRMDDGTSSWMDETRAIGNGVVPQVAARAFRELVESLELSRLDT